jgi:hypothetical protein
MTLRDELDAINAGFERALVEQDAERVSSLKIAVDAATSDASPSAG